MKCTCGWALPEGLSLCFQTPPGHGGVPQDFKRCARVIINLRCPDCGDHYELATPLDGGLHLHGASDDEASAMRSAFAKVAAEEKALIDAATVTKKGAPS